MISVGDNTDAGAVSFGGTQAASAQFQVGKVGFAPAWSGALTDAMDDAGICTACGNRMTPVRPGKAQCDFCETTEHMAESIVRLEHALDEANARIALLEEERNILGTASLSNALRGTTVTKAAVTEGAEPSCNDSAQVIRERPEPSPQLSSTPETDAATIHAMGQLRTAVVDVEFARALERERDGARARLKDIEDAMQAAENPHHDEVHCACVPLLRAALAEARGERDELRAVLESERDNWRAAAIQAVADRDRNKREWDKCAAELAAVLNGFDEMDAADAEAESVEAAE